MFLSLTNSQKPAPRFTGNDPDERFYDADNVGLTKVKEISGHLPCFSATNSLRFPETCFRQEGCGGRFYNLEDGSPAEDSKDEFDTSEFCDAHFNPENINFNDKEEQEEIARFYDGLESELSANEDEEDSNSKSGSDKAGETATEPRQTAGNRVRFRDFRFSNFGDENNLHSSFYFLLRNQKQGYEGEQISNPYGKPFPKSKYTDKQKRPFEIHHLPATLSPYSEVQSTRGSLGGCESFGGLQ